MAKRVAPEAGSVAVYACKRGSLYPQKEGWINIAAWSRGPKPWSALSPFFMGPIEDAQNFETYWQTFKVWDTVGGEKHVGPDGLPNEAWHAWQKKLRAKSEAVRRPNGYVKPLYAWFKGQKLDVIQARKQIYVPDLQRMYRAHPVYQQLLALVRGGQSVIIIEPDGPAEDVRCNPLSKETLVALQDCTTCKEAARYLSPDTPPGIASGRYFPYGHGYVIALTLLEDLEAEAK